MLGMFSSQTAPALRKSCESFLHKAGWTVKIGTGQPEDFEIESGILKYKLECVDQSVLSYRSVDLILDTMENHSRNKTTWIPLVFVFNFRLPFLSFDDLFSRGLIALSTTELHLIGELPNCLRDFTREIVVRQRALFEANTWACIEFSSKFEKAGNREAALRWARKAIKPTDLVGNAHHVVFGILWKAGETQDAYDLAKEAIIRRRNDPFLLNQLLKISQERGDLDEISHWTRYIDELGVSKSEVRNIDRILQPPQKSTSPIPEPKSDKPRFRLFGLLK